MICIIAQLLGYRHFQYFHGTLTDKFLPYLCGSIIHFISLVELHIVAAPVMIGSCWGWEVPSSVISEQNLSTVFYQSIGSFRGEPLIHGTTFFVQPDNAVLMPIAYEVLFNWGSDRSTFGNTFTVIVNLSSEPQRERKVAYFPFKSPTYALEYHM